MQFLQEQKTAMAAKALPHLHPADTTNSVQPAGYANIFYVSATGKRHR